MNYKNNLGTAGVWRIAAINQAGGWKDRTTVEDMDLAIRASLNGWKFVYLGDLQVSILYVYVSVLYIYLISSIAVLCICLISSMSVQPHDIIILVLQNL